MIQDVAEKLGNMDSGKVARALAESEKRIMSPMYMKPGMGDGGACHPRDNIALRYLAQDLDLGYDMFDTIINAREKQAQNMADEILNKGRRIQFSSDSFKPGTDITDGSYSLLVQHYVKEMGGKIVDENPHVYVLVHPGDKRHENNEVINFDPWDEYGNTR
jgi:UDPglucose 6-dehydrogenase